MVQCEEANFVSVFVEIINDVIEMPYHDQGHPLNHGAVVKIISFFSQSKGNLVLPSINIRDISVYEVSGFELSQDVFSDVAEYQRLDIASMRGRRGSGISLRWKTSGDYSGRSKKVNVFLSLQSTHSEKTLGSAVNEPPL
jgi:hypothetical protein